MTHRFVNIGFLGIVAVLGLGGTLSGCGGGGIDQNFLNSSSRSLIGTYRKLSIASNGTYATCGTPGSILGSPRTELKDRNVVIDVCTANDTLGFGEDGRFSISSQAGARSCTFVMNNQRLEMVTDSLNGATLPLPHIKTVYTVSGSSKNLILTPAPEPVSYQKIDPTADAFKEDGTPNYDNLAPLSNVDGTLPLLWLPNTDSKPVLKADLRLVPELIADAREAADARGFSQRYMVTYTFGK